MEGNTQTEYSSVAASPSDAVGNKGEEIMENNPPPPLEVRGPLTQDEWFIERCKSGIKRDAAIIKMVNAALPLVPLLTEFLAARTADYEVSAYNLREIFSQLTEESSN
jgi:hypothetical protein